MSVTPDGLPCVGKVNWVDELYIVAGYTNGISWAPVTAQLLAELITDHESSIPLTHLDPN